MSTPTKAKQFTSIVIVGRRWFQRTYGNTYNTVQITIDGTEAGRQEFELPMEYGYGDYYYQRAVEWLVANGWLNCNKNSHGGLDIPNYSERQALGIVNQVMDVPRKKDL